MEVIVKYHDNLNDIRDDLSAEVEILDQNYAIIDLDVLEIPLLYDYHQIEYVELSKPIALMQINSLRASCMSQVYSAPYGLSGRGVLISIIDSGIDYTHPYFINEDGTTRIEVLYDQDLRVEYSREQINEALWADDPLSVVPETDELGHGTAVAGVAAMGAPEAEFIIVKLRGIDGGRFSMTANIMRAIAYSINRARSYDIPVCVNISYGTNDGAHDGLTLFETFIDDMADRWKNSIIVATGNEGSSAHHFSGSIGQGENRRLNIRIASGLKNLQISLWKKYIDNMNITVVAPDQTNINYSHRQITSKEVGLDTSVYIYDVEPAPYTINQALIFEFASETEIQSGIWQIVFDGVNIVDGSFNMWLPTTEEVTAQTAFYRPDPYVTLTLPSTSAKVISVGGYNDLLDTCSEFSGRGFTSTGEVKPDLVAPAFNIISARAGGGTDSYSGTSMAAPFVTAAAALLMQWGIVNRNDLFMYGERLKAVLQKGASRDRNLLYPDPIWGYGKLCLKASIDLVR